MKVSLRLLSNLPQTWKSLKTIIIFSFKTNQHAWKNAIENEEGNKKIQKQN
jgi:uncharacterized phage-like protein YoqJ